MSGSSSQTTNENQKFAHNVFNNDPLLFKSYVNKQVSVTTEDSTVQSGIVYTVDPVSESIVLVDLKEDNKYDLKIVLGHTIKKIEVLPDTEREIPELFVAEKFSNTVALKRKETIMKVLEENRFPVTEKDGVIFIKDTVRIEPPYGSENCISTNTIILNRIQKIVSDVIK